MLMNIGLSIMSGFFTKSEQIVKVINSLYFDHFQARDVRAFGGILPELQIGGILIQQIVDGLIIYFEITSPKGDGPRILVATSKSKNVVYCLYQNSRILVLAQHCMGFPGSGLPIGHNGAVVSI